MDMPLLFWNELSQNKRAMQNYAALTPEEKQALSVRACRIRNAGAMRLLVTSMDDSERLTEYGSYF